MPELPEVETIVRDFYAAALIDKKITKAEVFWPRSLARPDVESFIQQIEGQTISSIKRRGKFLVFQLTTHFLLVHLRMTGKFILSIDRERKDLHERIRLHLSDGRLLCYSDQRKFGKWYFIANPATILANLGIEPLSEEFTLSAFSKLLKAHRTQIKPFLLNQRYIVGLGNIYVDEALWEAKIHPKRLASSLTKQEILALHTAIPAVLLRGILSMGTSLGSKNANYFSVSGRRGGNQHQLQVFRREGKPCIRCHTLISKIIVAQRGTHFCLKCQKIS